MLKKFKKKGFQEICRRISFGKIEESYVFVFNPMEFCDDFEDVYIFRVVPIKSYGFKKINGIKQKTLLISYEFYGTGFDKSSEEFWDISNDIKLKIGGCELNCPRSWSYKIQGDIKPEEIEQLLRYIEENPLDISDI